jgi:hypothetical protein
MESQMLKADSFFEISSVGTSGVGKLFSYVCVLNLMAAAAVGILVVAAIAVGVAMSMVIMPMTNLGSAKMHLVVAATLDSVVVMSRSEASSRRIDSSRVNGLDVSYRRFARLRVTTSLGPSTLKNTAADAAGRLKIGAVLVKGVCKMSAACRGLVMSVGVMEMFMVVVCVTYIKQVCLSVSQKCFTLHRKCLREFARLQDGARRARWPDASWGLGGEGFTYQRRPRRPFHTQGRQRQRCIFLGWNVGISDDRMTSTWHHGIVRVSKGGSEGRRIRLTIAILLVGVAAV